MLRSNRWSIGLGLVACMSGAVAMVLAMTSCGTAPTAFLIRGPGGQGNDVPTLTILSPNANLTAPQGVPFVIQWTDTDRDDNAQISFRLVNTTTNRVIILVDGIDENDQIGPDTHTVNTALIPVGTYNLLGTINDGVNAEVTSYAIVNNTATTRVIVRIVGEGEGSLSLPPTVAVAEPQFDLSVTQDDRVRIVVQPSLLAGANTAFDGDSDITLFLILDTDLDPTNDDPFNPDSAQIIVLQRQTVPLGATTLPPFDIAIDLNQIPSRPNGEPYFVRATVTDSVNKPVHSYAPGTLSIVELASGTVDLFDVGRRVSGAKFGGFSPSAKMGSTVRTVSDFDADGIADFMMVARFGNPQNVGPVGEAYLVYGRDKVRFGGTISANSISQTVSGVVFQAPPVRTQILGGGNRARTEGITDFSIVRDLTGDGRPDLLFGLPLVYGAFDSTDWDPEDGDPAEFDCYPDLLVNNATDEFEDAGLVDRGWFSGGMAVMVNSQNRDDQGTINLNRLESTAVALELSGQPRSVLDTNSFSAAGNILPRASNVGADLNDQLGNDESEVGRISGSRFIAGGYEFLFPANPREDLFGANVGSVGDMNSDGLDEIIVSSPTNERYLTDLRNSLPVGFFDPMLQSTRYSGSLTVFPGTNYNVSFWRELEGERGAAVSPTLVKDAGQCSDPPVARGLFLPAEVFEIFAENIDDHLGGGKSAGDFNLDGLGDILCSAPLNDRSSALPDSGAVYIIYGRPIFGEVLLSRASDPVLRPPMLRVRGVKRGDQIGFKQAAGLDVNGDRVDDIFISSPRTDFGGVARDTCAADFNGDGLINAGDLSLASFSDCQVSFGSRVFTSDPCKAFDYDNDGDIDEEDRCVYCCVAGTCTVESSCTFGREAGNCCANMVDNGFVGVIFGGRFIDGDRDITQMATSDLPGVIFYGGGANDLAGWDVSSAGDFNQDGFGDILIAAPGEVRRDSAGRERLGVVYLIFGGTHLINTQWNLSDLERGVGTGVLPGIVFISPFVRGRPNEAPPLAVGFIGDINNDGFGDIAIGNENADFIDLTFPQGPNAPGDDPSAGRRSDAGEAYVIYGNNFGPNRATP